MLYIVGTPIGNLQDLSYRQAKTLAEADVILSEDTRSTGILLTKIWELFGLTINSAQRIISYYKEKEFEKLPEILTWLEEEKNIALISQAGLPLVSDPGQLLVKTAIKRHIPFTVIPGPSAVTTALLYSGYDQQEFAFIGFLPKKTTDLRKLLDRLKQIHSVLPMTFVAFESPHRLPETLGVMAEAIPDARITVTRELTKIFEEVTHGTAHELMHKTYRGEITLVITWE